MKIFDRDGDGDFDLKDILIVSTLFGTILNLVLNLFGLLNLGVSFTVQDKAVLQCGVVDINGKKEIKCLDANQTIPIVKEDESAR